MKSSNKSERMNQLPPSVVIDDYITFLLRDASARIGICPVKTKTTEWVTLMGKEGFDDVQRVQNLKMVAYVIFHLLNANKLTKSFSNYFEYRLQMPFRNDIVITAESGEETTLIKLFRKKFNRFRTNFTDLSRRKHRITISKGENKLGGKGKQLEDVRTHNDVLQRRREKRSFRNQHKGRVFFLNCYMANGRKFIKVRSSACSSLKYIRMSKITCLLLSL